ncbi:MAG: Potassium-transporting ATPase alpha chain 1, partial [Paramarteilia canceri]
TLENESSNPLHLLSLKEICSKFGSSTDNGLPMRRFLENKKKYGPNVVSSRKKKSLFYIYMHEHLLTDFTFFCLSALFLSCVVVIYNKIIEDNVDIENISFICTLVFIILFTSCFTFISNTKRSKIVEKLNEINSNKYVSIIRDGSIESVLTEELVPGDLVLLKVGDQIPADLIVVDSKSLKVDNSSMTGESLPVKKSNKITSKQMIHSENSLLYSTHVVDGSGTGIVVATGNSTKVSQLFHFNSDSEEVTKTPMLSEISIFIVWSMTIAAAIILILIIGAIKTHEFLKAIWFSISIFIAFIPEGLILSFTFAQSITAKNIFLGGN